MKQTTFEFSVESASDDPEGHFRALAQRVTEISGVERVEQVPELLGCTLHVLVNFANPKSAMKLHANIVRVVTSFPAIRVTGASTCVSDVFE